MLLCPTSSNRAVRTILLECGERNFDTSVNIWHSRGPTNQVTFSLPCLGMTRALRIRQTYDHRLRDAIVAKDNAKLFRKWILREAATAGRIAADLVPHHP